MAKTNYSKTYTLGRKEDADAITARELTPPPSQPAPRRPGPILPTTAIEPTEQEVAELVRASGNEAAARTGWIQRRLAKAERIAEDCPELWAELEKSAAELLAIQARTRQALDSRMEVVNSLEQALKDRASHRETLTRLNGELTAIQAELDDPGSVGLPAPDLFRLEHRRRHLPTKIKETEVAIATATASIKTLTEENGIDLKRFIAGMHRRAGRGPDGYYHTDATVYRWIENGLISAD